MPEKVLYIYEGKLTRHGIDAVVRQQLQALGELGLHVDLVSRGNPRMPGVTFLGMKWTPANALSWLPRSIYYPAQKRFFMALGARLAKRMPAAWVRGLVIGTGLVMSAVFFARQTG